MENEILSGMVIALVSALLGWALSQATMGRKVAAALADMKLDLKLAIERSGNEAKRSQEEVSQIRNEVSEVRADTTQRMGIMANMVEKVLNVASELIELVKVQNALLAVSNKEIVRKSKDD